MLRISPFWFKRHKPPVLPPQRNITLAQVQTPGDATSADIVALFNLDDNKSNLDPNALGLYGTWTASPAVYSAHIGILSDNGFSKYLDGVGINNNDWGAGTLDTYFNNDGITLSWIARPLPVTGTRLMQYWQADTEFIDLYFLNAATIRLSAMLGTGTMTSADVPVEDLEIADGNFHHLSITFDIEVSRICIFSVDGIVAAQTTAIPGVAVFGDAVSNVRRGIGFGCSYSGPDIDSSGDIDHCTILKGVHPAIATGLEGRMKHNGIFMKYYGGQMYYNPGAAPTEGATFYGGDSALYEGQDVIYTNTLSSFSSGIPHWTAYD